MPFFFSERDVFDARNDRKLVQTCQSPVILPFRFIQSNKEHLTGFRVVYVIRTDRIRMFWILLPEDRSQNNNFCFCSRIINVSFNGLTYNTREHFVHCQRHFHRRNQGVSEYSYQKNRSQLQNKNFFCSVIINLFAHCSYFSSPLRSSEKYNVLYAKPSNNVYVIN